MSRSDRTSPIEPLYVEPEAAARQAKLAKRPGHIGAIRERYREILELRAQLLEAEGRKNGKSQRMNFPRAF